MVRQKPRCNADSNLIYNTCYSYEHYPPPISIARANAYGSNTVEALTTVNAAPVAPAIFVANGGGYEGVETRKTITPTGFTNPAYTVTLSDDTAAPNWVTVVGSEVVLNPPFGTVPAGAPFQPFTFKITATEGTTTASNTFIFTLVATSGPPAIISGDSFFDTRHDVIAGESTPLDAISHVDSNPSISFSQLVGNGNPTWAFLNSPIAGQFTVTPPTTALGNHDISFRFCNQNNATSCTEFTLQLRVVADTAPSFGSTAAVPNQTYTVGTAITALTVPAATGGNGILTYSLTNLPAGLTFDADTRIISGTPTDPATTAPYTLTAIDTDSNAAASDVATLTFTITVNAAPVAITDPDVEDIYYTTEFSLSSNVRAVPPNILVTLDGSRSTGTPPLNYLWTQVGGSSITLNGATTAMPSFTTPPAQETIQDMAFRLVVTDATGVASAPDYVALTVHRIFIDTPPSFVNAEIADQTYTVGTAIAIASRISLTGRISLPSAIDGNGDLTYTLTPGLPAGLTFDPDRRFIKGTPTEPAETMTYTLTVTDADGNTEASDADTLTFDITVNADTAPSFGGATVDDQTYTVGMDINNFTVLPAATENSGNGNLYYTLTPGLPAGLTFDSIRRSIKGTPTEPAEITTYTLTVRDGDGNIANDTDTLTFDITVNPDTTKIPDPDFERALINLGYDSGEIDGLVLTANISEVDNLDVSSRGITNLSGIEAFTSLVRLDCYSNQLTILDVYANTALISLDCRSNQLTILDVYANTALISLDCRSNQLTTLDVSENTALTSLDCGFNQLTNLDVSENTALTHLDCTLNQLLTSLNVKNGNNRNLSFNAVGSPNLTCIQVDNVSYSTINWSSYKDTTASYNTTCGYIITTTAIPDPNFEQALIDLEIDSGDIDGVVLTADISGVTSLNVSNKGITNLSGIEAFTSLVRLDCRSNQLVSLDVSQNTALTFLNCRSNQLSELNVSQNTALISLNANMNNLEELDVSNNTELTSLRCKGNQLTSLNVKNGNNSNFIFFKSTNNSSLTCIQVDDVGDSRSKWRKDGDATYSENCTSPTNIGKSKQEKTISDFDGNKGFELSEISVSPNPTGGVLNITVVEKANYRLVNIRGQILKKGILAKGKSSISLSSFAKGVYLLNLKTSKGNFTKKVVKN